MSVMRVFNEAILLTNVTAVCNEGILLMRCNESSLLTIAIRSFYLHT